MNEEDEDISLPFIVGIGSYSRYDGKRFKGNRIYGFIREVKTMEIEYMVDYEDGTRRCHVLPIGEALELFGDEVLITAQAV